MVAVAMPAVKRQIDIDGSELAPEIDIQLESVLVADRLAMPDMFELVFRDPDCDVLKRAGLAIGTKVAISTALGGDATESIMDGEVTAIEADYDTSGPRAIVRGYDLSHRLNAGRKTQTFQNVKVSDVAKQLASAAGLQVDVDDSGGTIEHVLQPNLSDLDFLYNLARQIGYDCRVDGEKLSFKRPTESSSAPAEGEVGTENPVQLVWSDNLLEFRARVSAVAQVSEVKVRGWDVANKEVVIGKAEAAATSAELPLTAADLADKVGGQTLVVVDRPVGSQEAADALAAAKAEQVGSAAFEASAVAIGSPALRAGVAVSVSGVDEMLAGKWVISSTRHEFGDGGAYRTHIEFSGRQDRSLHGVLANGVPGASGSRYKSPGVAVAIVTNNDDPDGLGRVKLKFPWLSDDVESFWARVAMPGAGPDSGMVWIPEVGDEVLVAFEMGDLSFPYVIGGLWNGVDKPLLGDGLCDAGTIKRRGFVSRKGHKIVFFDDDDKSGIALISANGKFKISLDETKKQIHIVADEQVLIEAKKITLKAQDEAAIEAKNISLKASAEVKIKGNKVALNPPGA
jgi:phage protein D/phage baseplate assembly protein gpV